MSVIVKSFMGMFFFALIVLLGVGFIRYQTDVCRALHYQRDFIREMQNSNFSPSVINACIQTGERHDYEVSVRLSRVDGSLVTCSKQNPAVSGGDVTAAYVTVRYKSRAPLLGLETSNHLRGIAK